MLLDARRCSPCSTFVRDVVGMCSLFSALSFADDTNKDGKLGWNEAKQYISDLLELSGMQAMAIREARDAGQTDISQWYNTYLREIFDLMDSDHDGYICLEELVSEGTGMICCFLNLDRFVLDARPLLNCCKLCQQR
jgi:hypothetical protein